MICKCDNVKKDKMTLNRRLLKRVHSPGKSPKRVNTSLRKKTLLKQLSGDVQFGAASKANVKVVVRIRPQNARELERGDRPIIKVVDHHMMIFDPKVDDGDFFFKGIRQRSRDLRKRQYKEQKFMFERLFDENSTNEEIYQETTKDLVDTLLSGYNCSVFAYGATGAGKTYTMLGKPENPGITFLTLMELYRRIDDVKEEKTCEVGVSYLEVYNETVRDLLQPGKLLNVQENGTQVLVPGLSLHKPKDADDLLKMLAFGNQNRSQHPTDANEESSRSHAVFQIFVRQQDRTASLKSNFCIAKLSMIDLAGSERGTATGYKGARFREGANINKSLLALGNCINALADGLRHVPYRDSKLTRLLKDSLGGNCRSVMIAAISSASLSFEDSFNTLRYANRAKTIKTTLKKNLLNIDQHVTQYVKVVEDLREEICFLKEKIKKYEEKEAEWQSNDAALQLANEALEKHGAFEEKIADLEKQLQEKVAAAAEQQSSMYIVSEEEKSVQRRLEEASIEQKGLRRELLQLESSQRELELKIHISSLHLQRMKIVSFASQRLDKSISKCERTIRNLSNRFEQTKVLQENVERKLNLNQNKLHEIQMDLNQWGMKKDEPSQASKVLIEKTEATLAERDLQHLAEYLRGLVKEGVAEQSSSEQLICQLLGVVKEFYVQLRANNVCSPEMESLFEGVIDSMDESKIIWADQQRNRDQDSHNPTCNIAQPELDVGRLTILPILTDVFISPAVPQNNKIFRRSIMKSSSSTCLQDTPARVINLKSEPDKNELSKIEETDVGIGNTTPESPILSVFSSDDYVFKPSPVIGSSHLPVKTIVAETTCQGPAKVSFSDYYSPSARTSPGISSVQLPVITTGGTLPAVTTSLSETGQTQVKNTCGDVPSSSVTFDRPSPVLSQGRIVQLEPTTSSFGFVSMIEQEKEPEEPMVLHNHTSCDLNATELLEDVQPVECSINSTFAITPAKGLNVTMDMPSSTHAALNTTIDMPNKTPAQYKFTSMLSSTKAFKIQDLNVPSSVLNTTIDKPSCQRILNTTVDLSDPSCNEADVPVKPPSEFLLNHPVVTETGTSASRKLFQPGGLDSTFSLESGQVESCSPGCLPLELKSPDVLIKPSNVVETSQRSPLASLENKCPPQEKSKVSLAIPLIRSSETPMPPPSSMKKGILKKPWITPHKTPSKTTTPGKAKEFLSVSKNTGGLRRSRSTSSLAPNHSSSMKKNPVSPILNRKYNGLGGALRRTTSFLKPNRQNKNQENLPPQAPKSSSQGVNSLAHKETISSAAKHILHGLQKT